MLRPPRPTLFPYTTLFRSATAGLALRGVLLQPVLPHQGGRRLARHDRRAAPHARPRLLRSRRRLGGRARRGPVARRRGSAVSGVGARGGGLRHAVGEEPLGVSRGAPAWPGRPELWRSRRATASPGRDERWGSRRATASPGATSVGGFGGPFRGP